MGFRYQWVFARSRWVDRMETNTSITVDTAAAQQELPEQRAPRRLRREEKRWMALFDRLSERDQEQIVLLARLKLHIQGIEHASDDATAADPG
jgi:hypothetical protein